MGRFSTSSHKIAAATRGQIVQRVLVERWSAAQAAADFGVTERQVARWVSAYRRYGMASLRDNEERAPRRWLRRLAAALGQIVAPPAFAPPERHAVRFVSLHRQGSNSHRH